LQSRSTKRDIIALALSVIIIGAIFTPLPGVNAVRVELHNADIQAGGNTAVDLKVVAQNPTAITFPGGIHSETLPSGVIRVTLDPGTISEKIISFNFTGHVLSDGADGIITGLTFGGITHGTITTTSFDSGSSYGYGFGKFSGIYKDGTIGDGSTVTGISSQPYGVDTTDSYKINFNPSLLSTGSHHIRVDVLRTSGDSNFFSSGDISFTNSADPPPLQSHGGSSYVPPSLDLNGLAGVQGALPDNIRNQILNHDPLKPMSPSYDHSFDYPFSIDGGGYVLAGLTNTIVTQTEKTGIPVDVKLNIQSSTIQHVALYTNLRGDARDIDKSDTFIIYEKGQPLQIVDPHGYFADVKFDISPNGINTDITCAITFAKPMEKSDIDLRIWNDLMSSSDNKILDAWKIEPSSSTAQSQTGPITTMQDATHVSNPSYMMSAIKDWGGYSSNPISDSKLLYHMGIKGDHIPSWVMKLTKYVVNGDITEKEFASTIKYLSANGLIT
jgi:hypothetical protein